MYCGRFAPTPSGPLHQGSLVSALASYLDARVHSGRWLVRIEDIDAPRNQPGAAEHILHTLACYGMRSDAPPLWQSARAAAYQAALEHLIEAGLVYPCSCTRKDLTRIYPGTCRHGLHGRMARAWRLRVPSAECPATAEQPHLLAFTDRRHGTVAQDLVTEVGDFILKRADGQWAYQLAVVVDDAAAGVTHVVRGADLIDSTPRQIYLQRLLQTPTPLYLHVPIVTHANGEKLSKQTHATPLDLQQPLPALQLAAQHLGFTVHADTLEQFYQQACVAWERLLRTRPAET